MGLTTMLLPRRNPPRATRDALFSSPYFFFFPPTSCLSVRFVQQLSPVLSSEGFFPPPPSSSPSKCPARRGKILSSTRQIVPKGRWPQGLGCFVQKHLLQAPRHVLLFTKKAIFVHRMTPLTKHLNMKVYDLWLSRKASPYHGDVLVKALQLNKTPSYKSAICFFTFSFHLGILQRFYSLLHFYIPLSKHAC